jgi:hypothetical protein
MKSYVVTAVFEVHSGKAPRVDDVLRHAWPTGHIMSRFDGTSLTVIVQLRAADPAAAGDLVVGRACRAWPRVAQSSLPAPLSVRVVAQQPALVSAGRRIARLRPPRKAANSLRGLTLRWMPPDDEEGGGLAGVREPRRPMPGPGHLSAERAIPR